MICDANLEPRKMSNCDPNANRCPCCVCTKCPHKQAIKNSQQNGHIEGRHSLSHLPSYETPQKIESTKRASKKVDPVSGSSPRLTQENPQKISVTSSKKSAAPKKADGTSRSSQDSKNGTVRPKENGEAPQRVSSVGREGTSVHERDDLAAMSEQKGHYVASSAPCSFHTATHRILDSGSPRSSKARTNGYERGEQPRRSIESMSGTFSPATAGVPQSRVAGLPTGHICRCTIPVCIKEECNLTRSGTDERYEIISGAGRENYITPQPIEASEYARQPDYITRSMPEERIRPPVVKGSTRPPEQPGYIRPSMMEDGTRPPVVARESVRPSRQMVLEDSTRPPVVARESVRPSRQMVLEDGTRPPVVARESVRPSRQMVLEDGMRPPVAARESVRPSRQMVLEDGTRPSGLVRQSARQSRQPVQAEYTRPSMLDRESLRPSGTVRESTRPSRQAGYIRGPIPEECESPSGVCEAVRTGQCMSPSEICEHKTSPYQSNYINQSMPAESLRTPGMRESMRSRQADYCPPESIRQSVKESLMQQEYKRSLSPEEQLRPPIKVTDSRRSSRSPDYVRQSVILREPFRSSDGGRPEENMRTSGQLLIMVPPDRTIEDCMNANIQIVNKPESVDEENMIAPYKEDKEVYVTEDKIYEAYGPHPLKPTRREDCCEYMAIDPDKKEICINICSSTSAEQEPRFSQLGGYGTTSADTQTTRPSDENRMSTTSKRREETEARNVNDGNNITIYKERNIQTKPCTPGEMCSCPETCYKCDRRNIGTTTDKKKKRTFF